MLNQCTDTYMHRIVTLKVQVDGFLSRFQILADFEERACASFATPIEDGYTFEQEALHREFCRLFDGFCAGYLHDKGLSEVDFQRVLQAGEYYN